MITLSFVHFSRKQLSQGVLVPHDEPIFVVDQEYWKPWKAEIDRLGLTVFTVTFLGADMNTISADPTVRQKGIEFLKKAVDITAYLGASYLSGPFHSALAVFSGAAPTQQELDWSKESMLAVADHAKEKNVIEKGKTCENFHGFTNHYLWNPFRAKPGKALGAVREKLQLFR